MLFSELALAARAFAAWAQTRADAEAAALSQLIVQPILERLIPMTVDVSKLAADFATFRGDLTATLADARAKMDELQALKLSDADAQAKIDALDASLGDLEAQVKPATSTTDAPPPVDTTPAASVPVSTDPVAAAPVSTDPTAIAPAAPAADPSTPAAATDPTAGTTDTPAPDAGAPATDPASAPAAPAQQDGQVSLTA